MSEVAEVFTIVPASGKWFWILLVGISILMFLLLCLFGSIYYSSRKTTFELGPSGLRIGGTLYGRTIPAHALSTGEAEAVSLYQSVDYRPRWRTNGIGMPGYRAGWFRLRNGDKALLFVTDPTRVVRIPTRDGYAIMFSVPEPKRFVAALRESVPGS